jgi:hypothetical protein
VKTELCPGRYQVALQGYYTKPSFIFFLGWNPLYWRWVIRNKIFDLVEFRAAFHPVEFRAIFDLVKFRTGFDLVEFRASFALAELLVEFSTGFNLVEFRTGFALGPD